MQSKAFEYFRNHKDSFWHWAEDGKVIEWKEGPTICYREDLVNVLANLVLEGFPALGTILLVLYACAKDIQEDKIPYKALFTNWSMVSTRILDEDLDKIIPHVEKSISFIKIIRKLPETYKSGIKRIHLINTICEYSEHKIGEIESIKILEDFNSGQYDKEIFESLYSIWDNNFALALTNFEKALLHFPDTNTLQRKLDTGVTILPTPLENVIDIPVETPATDSEDILAELDNDIKTSGLSALTRQLIAAINIPRHAQGNSERAHGGVSDISNKGDFDRLLLSELAYEDNTLMARLANNEALFLRREDLPADNEEVRCILIDSTIRMWGIPKLFGMAAALTCSVNVKNNQPVEGFILQKTGYIPLNLNSKEDIVMGLGTQDAALTCFKALEAFMDERHYTHGAKYFLVTEEHSLKSRDFVLTLSQLKKPLNYLITVNRNGRLNLFEFAGKGMKLASTSLHDLNGILFKARPTRHYIEPSAPFYKEMPFYYPSSKVKMKGLNWHFSEPYLFVVNEDQRLLFWKNRESGAIELLNYIEPGDYYFILHEMTIHILVLNKSLNFMKLYQISMSGVQIKELQLDVNLPYSEVLVTVNRSFVFNSSPYDCTAIHIPSWEIEKISKGAAMREYQRIQSQQKDSLKYQKDDLKKLINPGYNVIHKASSIYIDDEGFFSIDKWQLTTYQGNLIWSLNPNKNRREKHAKTSENIFFDEIVNKKIPFKRFSFADGSSALMDGRGLLHLKSSDPSIPEISIIMATGVFISAFANDGNICGNSYFIKEHFEKARSVPDFYASYIQPFINGVR